MLLLLRFKKAGIMLPEFKNHFASLQNLQNQMNALQDLTRQFDSLQPFNMPIPNHNFNQDPFLNPWAGRNVTRNTNAPSNAPSYADHLAKAGTPEPLKHVPTEKELRVYLGRDSMELINSSYQLIAGYLNLTEKDGWKQGADGKVGAAFTRFLLVKYFLEGKEQLSFNKPVLVKTINGFAADDEGCLPKKSRICYDTGVTGWEGHQVSRLVGNLGSQYDASKPFFEIIINSQRINGNPVCKPFFVTIYKNEKELDERRQKLASLNKTEQDKAYHVYFASNHKKPEHYWSENKARLGPNSTHLLQGLEFLQNVELSAQKSGNCWLKQPMRSLLAGLFIEYHTHVKEVPAETAWNQAEEVYKRIHKAVAIPHVEGLLGKVNLTSQMKESALRGIEVQKQL